METEHPEQFHDGHWCVLVPRDKYAALVALYEAHESYEWDEGTESMDAALYRWELAMKDAAVAVTAILKEAEHE